MDGLGLVSLRWREDHPKGSANRAPERVEDQKRAFRRALADAGLDGLNPRFDVRVLRGSHFHDRQILADFSRAGEQASYRFDLSSGIDNLMDRNKEAKIFRTLLAANSDL